MSTYAFRLKFLLPEGIAINHDSQELKIPLASGIKALSLVPVYKNIIKESRELAIICNGLTSENEANNYGTKVRDSLLYCTTLLKIGIDCSEKKPTSMIGGVVKDRAKEQGILLLNDVHAFCTYPDDNPVRFIRFRGTTRNIHSADKFINEFTKAFALSLNFSDKVLLAFELYGAAHFETSLRAKFLTLVNAVESLCTQDKQSAVVLTHLEKLVELTTHEQLENDTQRKTLINRLRQLKRESISSSCRVLVEKHLGIYEAKLFKSYYNTRSTIVHNGREPKHIDLGTDTPNLDDLVSRLLIKIATASALPPLACSMPQQP